MASDSLEEFLDTIEDDGTHPTILDVATQSVSKDGRVWNKFVFVVDNPDSDLDGEEYQDMMQDFSHLTPEDFKELPSDERKKIKIAIRRKKQRLASLGVPENELNDFTGWDSLKGKRYDITIVTNGDFKNIVAVAATTD